MRVSKCEHLHGATRSNENKSWCNKKISIYRSGSITIRIDFIELHERQKLLFNTVVYIQ